MPVKTTLKDELAKHVTMWRAMVMATEVEKLFCEGKPAHARAQNLANFKAWHRAVSNGGHWREAWQYCYLPDLVGTESGATMGELFACRFSSWSFAVEERSRSTDHSSSVRCF